MITTVEKVLFLKSIDLFSQIPGEELSQIALITDEVQALTNSPGVMLPHVKAGKTKMLAVVSNGERYAPLPQVPTLKEQGYDLDFRNWIALYFPRATPNEAVRAWNLEVNRIMADARFVEKFFVPQSVTPAGGTPEDLSVFARLNRQTAAELAKIANLKFD